MIIVVCNEYCVLYWYLQTYPAFGRNIYTCSVLYIARPISVFFSGQFPCNNILITKKALLMRVSTKIKIIMHRMNMLVYLRLPMYVK